MDKIDSDYVFYGHEHAGRIDFINGKEFYGIGSSGCRMDNTTYYYIIDKTKPITGRYLFLLFFSRSFNMKSMLSFAHAVS